ncbi:hypothetical protein [Curtobacterium flaccumfaciens]|nr:hypothetical protein [Curtobacterium flaccumfaciens]
MNGVDAAAGHDSTSSFTRYAGTACELAVVDYSCAKRLRGCTLSALTPLL